MGENPLYEQTYWETVSAGSPNSFPPLEEDTRADVAVVGAGIVGLTAAYELARAGKKVVVLEARQLASQATARSTAKVTSQHGLIYGRLIRNFGEDNARLYAMANQDAIEHIATMVEKESIECAFERKAAYVYAPDLECTSAVNDEAIAAAMLGLPARAVREIPAPVTCTAAVCFDDQAQFNPVQYLRGLSQTVSRMARVYENTRVVSIDEEDEQQLVKTEDGHTVTARHVVVATHLPIVPEGKYFAKAFTFSHTVAAAPLPSDIPVEGMFVSAGTPSHSFRLDTWDGTPYVIATGPSYETGVADELARSLNDLNTFLQEHFSIDKAEFHWTNLDYRSMDEMPFAGRISSSTPRLYVATGFNAWGITNGVVAARIIADQVLQRENAYSELFDASRIKPLAGGTEFVKENLMSAKQMVMDYLSPKDKDASDHVPLGEARVVREDGENIARYRDMDGCLHEVSAVCTHMGCVVEWNDVDRTWDCPCHGSRFGPDGCVLHGPATKPLEKVGTDPD